MTIHLRSIQSAHNSSFDITQFFAPNLCYTDSLLKKTRTGRAWNDRYFIFTEDGILRYYNSQAQTQDDRAQPKARYNLLALPDCQVSDLFVAKNGKQLLYCAKITWSSSDETLDGDASQSFVGSVDDDTVGFPSMAAPTEPPWGTSPKPKPNFLRRRRHNSREASRHQGADDESSITLETNHIKRQQQIQQALNMQSNEIPRIPTMVQVETPNNNSKSNNQNNNSSDNNTTVAIEEKEYLRAQFLTSEKESRKKYQRKLVEGTKFAAAAGATVGVAVMTAGVGLLAGLVFLGAAAGSSGAAMTWGGRQSKNEIVLASSDYEKMKRWKACLDATLESDAVAKSTWGQLFVGGEDGQRRAVALFPKSINSSTSPRSPRRKELMEQNTSYWRPMQGGWAVQGLRIFREERPQHQADTAGDNRPCPPFKSHVVVQSSALDAFLCLMSYGRLPPRGDISGPNSGQRASHRILERIDDNTDVIHMICSPLYLFPSWTTARDFCLYRYWRHEEDGTFVVCYESVEHKDCPPRPDFCRGEMHQVFTIAPLKRAYRRKATKEGANSSGAGFMPESLMTAWVQVDPKGWVPTTPMSFLANQAYGDAFSVAALMHLIDVCDAIDQDRFTPVSMDGDEYRHVSHRLRSSFDLGDAGLDDDLQRNQSMDTQDVLLLDDRDNYDFAYAGADRESVVHVDSATGFTSHPDPFLREKWAEPDANSFRVRGKHYKVDRLKINAGTSIGRLVAVDIVTVDAPIYSGMTTHPTERLQMALKKEKSLQDGVISDLPPFVFCVNIVLPGPPFYHGVFYYAIDDMSKIDGSDGTPSSRLAREFFFGDSDEFRDRTFKLIPQIVQGNFIVRKAVGSKPAIMGRKLRQFYVRTERSFEVVLDCGSSPVATGVIRLSLGYAKTLVVDMGFLLEGDELEFLPERIFGAVRVREPEFDPAVLRKVKAPVPQNGSRA